MDDTDQARSRHSGEPQGGAAGAVPPTPSISRDSALSRSITPNDSTPNNASNASTIVHNHHYHCCVHHAPHHLQPTAPSTTAPASASLGTPSGREPPNWARPSTYIENFWEAPPRDAPAPAPARRPGPRGRGQPSPNRRSQRLQRDLEHAGNRILDLERRLDAVPLRRAPRSPSRSASSPRR